MRQLPFPYIICQLIVSEISYFNTAERIQIIIKNIYKRDLNNNNLKSLYNYKYLIRLSSKTLLFISVILQFALCL